MSCYFVVYCSLSLQHLIVVQNRGHVVERLPMEKTAFKLHSGTTSWLLSYMYMYTIYLKSQNTLPVY